MTGDESGYRVGGAGWVFWEMGEVDAVVRLCWICLAWLRRRMDDTMQ